MSGPRRREAYWRGVFSLATFVVTFVLVSQDAPFVVAVSEVAFDLMFHSWAVNLQIHVASFRSQNMLAPSLLVSAVITLPIFVYQVVALATVRPYDPRRLVCRTFVVSAAFALGLAVAYRVVLPAQVAYRLRWDPAEITVMMSLEDRLSETAALLLGGGLLFAAPALLAFLVAARKSRGDDRSA